MSGSTISTGSSATYTPSTEIASNYLTNGIYLISLLGYYTSSGNSSTYLSLAFTVAVTSNNSISPGGAIVQGISMNNVIGNTLTNHVVSLYTPTFVVTVTSPTYYYGYANITISSGSGTSYTPTVQITSITRIG